MRWTLQFYPFFLQMPKAKTKSVLVVDSEQSGDGEDIPTKKGKRRETPSGYCDDHKLQILEAVAPHVSFLFGKLSSSCTHSDRRDMMCTIIRDLRAQGIDIPENDHNCLKRKILEPMRRKTAEKLAKKRKTGEGYVHLTPLDKRVIDVFNLEGLHTTGLKGHDDPPPETVDLTPENLLRGTTIVHNVQSTSPMVNNLIYTSIFLFIKLN